MVLKESFGDCLTDLHAHRTPTQGTRNDAIQPNGTPVLPGPGAWPDACHRDSRLLKWLKFLDFHHTEHTGVDLGVGRRQLKPRRQWRLVERGGGDLDQLEQVLQLLDPE